MAIKGVHLKANIKSSELMSMER